MSITQNQKNGKFYYAFMIDKKRYHGACKGCTTRAQAEAFERKMWKTATELAPQKSAKGLIDNFKRELTGGTDILLESAFDVYMTKPARRHPGAMRQGVNRRRWEDFVAFMKATYPETVRLDQVTVAQGEAYIDYLRREGRFIQDVPCGKKDTDKRYTPKRTSLSNKTINEYHTIIKSVFSRLENDAGIVVNPFSFDPMKATTESRDIFIPEELTELDQNLATDSFCRPLFIIGANTGLSLGDVCTLRWDDIRTDDHGCFICRKRNKTEVMLEIPVLPAVKELLGELAADRAELDPSEQSPYVLPEHAAMYNSKNRTGVSYRIHKFLTKHGIVTTRETIGARRASIKDFHSLRHTFAYVAGVNHIPLSIVQAVLGHMSPEMTRHYQEHATRTDMSSFMKKLPSLMGDQSLLPARQPLLIESAEKTEQVDVSSLSPDEADKLFWRRKVEKILENLSVDELKSIVKQYGNQANSSQMMDSDQQ